MLGSVAAVNPIAQKILMCDVDAMGAYTSVAAALSKAELS